MGNLPDFGGLSDLDIWNILVGFFLPVAVSVIKQPRWSKPVKTIAAFVVFVIVGFITAWLAGVLDGATIIRCILVVALSALTFYNSFWKPLGADAKITHATSPRNTRKV